jgi:hypothetical protein
MVGAEALESVQNWPMLDPEFALDLVHTHVSGGRDKNSHVRAVGRYTLTRDAPKRCS